MVITPILAHGADLLVLPFLVGAVVVIAVALKDGTQNRPSMPTLPRTLMGRQIRAAMRVAAPVRREASARAPRTQMPTVRLLAAETKDTRRPVPRRWNG